MEFTAPIGIKVSLNVVVTNNLFFRSQAMGLFYVFSQLGGALAPWIAKALLRYHVTLPLFVLGAFPIIASILALSLKETKGKAIDQQGKE